MSSPQTIKLSHIKKAELYQKLLDQIGEYLKVGDTDEQRDLQQNLLELVKKHGLISSEVLQTVADYQEKRMLVPGMFGQFTILHREVKDALANQEDGAVAKKTKKKKPVEEELEEELDEEEEEEEEDEDDEESEDEEGEDEEDDGEDEEEEEEEDEEEDDDDIEDEDEEEEEDEEEDDDIEDEEEEEEEEAERFTVQKGTGARKYAVVDTQTGEVMTTTGKEEWAKKLAAKWNLHPPEEEEEEEKKEKKTKKVKAKKEDIEEEEEDEEEEEEEEEEEAEEEEAEEEEEEEEEEKEAVEHQDVSGCYEMDEGGDFMVLPLGDKKFKPEGLQKRKKKGVVFPTLPHLKWARGCNASRFFEVVAVAERTKKAHWKILKGRGMKQAAFENQWTGWLGGYFKKDGFHLVETKAKSFQILLDLP